MKAEITDYFDKNYQKFLKLRKKVHLRPDEENVHDLRIASRRLLTLIRIFQLDPFSKPLKKAANKLGDLRDVDVSVSHANEYGLETKKLKAERKKLRKKVKKFFTKDHQKIIEKIIHHAQVKLTEKNEDDLHEVVNNYKEEMLKWKDVPIGRENFHQFRIALKKARYILEAQGEKVKDLVRLQDLLGDIHDLEVLTDKTGTTDEIQHMKLREFEEAVKLKRRLQKEEFLFH
jgi:CHAD domain-containing protein